MEEGYLWCAAHLPLHPAMHLNTMVQRANNIDARNPRLFPIDRQHVCLRPMHARIVVHLVRLFLGIDASIAIKIITTTISKDSLSRVLQDGGIHIHAVRALETSYGEEKY